MKRIAVVVLIVASLQSVAYASGNLRAHQNLGHIEEVKEGKDLPTRFEAVLHMKEEGNPDGSSRLLEERTSDETSTIMTREQEEQHEGRRKMESDDLYYKAIVEEEPVEETSIFGGVVSRSNEFPYFGTYVSFLL